MKKPESKFKKGDMVTVKNSENRVPKRITKVFWNAEYTEWQYRLPSDIAPFFDNELELKEGK